MKHTLKLITSLLVFGFFFSVQTTEAQFLKKLKKKVEKAAEDAVIRKAEKKTEKEVDDIFDKKEKKEKEINGDEKKSKEILGSEKKTGTEEKSLEVWRNYKFIPGEKVIFYDDLKAEEVGEFPSRWDLIKGGAEIVTFNGEKVIMGTTDNNAIMPLFKDSSYLSDEFTIEFDIYVDNISNEEVNYWSGYNVTFNSKNIEKRISMGTTSHISLDLRYGKISGFASDRKFEIEEVAINKNSWNHIAMSYHKGKFKLYIDDKRVINLPKFSIVPKAFMIDMFGYPRTNKTNIKVAIKNIRIAHGGGQMYKRIMADGKYVTGGILFDSGKATIKLQSMGVINKIASIMNENPDWKFQIIGHTDSDGSSEKNLLLSQQRAESVKSTLISLGIKAERLTTLGKGETESLNTNSTPEEKSNNRRVEFIKI